MRRIGRVRRAARWITRCARRRICRSRPTSGGCLTPRVCLVRRGRLTRATRENEEDRHEDDAKRPPIHTNISQNKPHESIGEAIGFPCHRRQNETLAGFRADRSRSAQVVLGDLSRPAGRTRIVYSLDRRPALAAFEHQLVTRRVQEVGHCLEHGKR